MRNSWRRRLAAPFLGFACAVALPAQQVPDVSVIVRGVDASVKSRLEHLAGYTVTEHYVLFRGQDLTNPAAQMLVKTTYRKETGKTYAILSQSGSGFWRSQVLDALLDGEKKMSQPGNVQTALLTSANYEMSLDREAEQELAGRRCFVLDIRPRRSSQYLFKGWLWVDARDYAIVQLKGTATKSAFFLASAAEVTRQYTEIDDLPMASHAEAVSGSNLLGQTVVKIDYSDYQLNLTASP